MLFWKSWFDKKIFFIQDILNGDGNFLTFEEFQNKFLIKTNYLHYFQLMAAIPSDLKKKAMLVEVPYLFGYKPISAISRDPKLLMQKINFIDTNCKCIILGYKPRAIFGLEVYRGP